MVAVYAWFRAKSRLGQVEKMTITGIEEMNHKKVRVFIDNEFAFVLYKGELRSYQIKEGSEIKEVEYLEITEKLLPKRAKLRCMNLLKAKSYTEKQLRDKLVQGEYRKEAIEEAIEYVKSYGYVDDRKYAEDFITYHMKKKSRKKMELDLYRKGIDRKIVQEIWERLSEEGEEPDELSIARELLRKKNFDPEMAGNKEKQKMSAFLYRKGFDIGIIRSVLLLDITSI